MLLSGLVVLAGCAGVTPLPARTHGPSGNQIQPKQIDAGFVQVGTTKRQEVVDKLNSINVGCSSPRLFWGRWADSNWGYWWFFVAPSAGGGGGGAGAGDAKRLWHVRNIVVSFDENGVARSVKQFEGDSSLWRELHDRVPDLAPLDFAQLQSFHVGRRGESEFKFGKDFMEIDRRKKPPARIPPGKVWRVSHKPAPDKRNDPGLTCHVLYFSEKTEVGKKLEFCAQGPEVITLFQYLQQTGAKDMQWE